jgi:hypothetical protein
LFGVVVLFADMQKSSGKGRGKPTSGKGSGSTPQVLYNSRGERVKGYYLVEDEVVDVEKYQDDYEGQEQQGEYEHPGSGRPWRSWADVNDWVEQYPANTDYVDDYQEEYGDNRWTRASGKGRGQAERTSRSRPPVVRSSAQPKEDEGRYYEQDRPLDRGVAAYVPSSGKGSGKPPPTRVYYEKSER